MLTGTKRSLFVFESSGGRNKLLIFVSKSLAGGGRSMETGWLFEE